MFTRRKALLLAVALLLPSVGRPEPLPAPPPSSAGTFPLSGVHAGMHGTAWTVFEGTEPAPFGVDILGVLHNAEGPGEDLILARLTGAKVEYDGVVAGMSGSPVYIDGKLAGAIAYRIGQFAKEPIAGITPIGQMLPVRDMADSALAPVPPAGGTAIQPIETQLVFSGFSPEALSLWKQHAPSLGMEPAAGLGGSADPTSADPTEVGQQTSGPAHKALPPLEPGSAVSALLVSGDMEIAATCTVTYLDAKNLLACGHPLTQAGAVSLPMTRAEVVATLASPAGSFKIVNTGATVGAFTEDRQTAIGGLLGAAAHTIPVTIAMNGAGMPPRTIHLAILDQPDLTPTALLVSLFQALQETPDYGQENSYRLHATVQLSGYGPVTIDTLAAPGGALPPPLATALTLESRFNDLYSSDTRRSPVESVTVHVEVLPGRRTITLNGAAVEQTEVHAGDRVTVAVRLLPYRGAARSVSIPVTLPASLPAGNVRLLVSDGPTLDRLLQAGSTAGSAPLAGTVHTLNSLHPDDRLYLTLLAPNAQVALDGRVLTSVPLSVANLLLAAHENDRASLHSETVEPLASVPLDASLSGEQTLTVRVE